KRVQRNLRQLRVLERHAPERNAGAHDVAIAGLEVSARLRVDLSDQEEIGVEKVANHAPERDELRTVADAELGAGALPRLLLQHRHETVAGRAGQDRAAEDDGVPVFRGGGRAPELAEAHDGETSAHALAEEYGSTAKLAHSLRPLRALRSFIWCGHNRRRPGTGS